MKRTDQRQWHDVPSDELRSSFIGRSRVHWSERIRRFGRLRNAEEIAERGEFPTPQDWIDAFYQTDDSGNRATSNDFNQRAWTIFVAFLVVALGVRLLR